MSGVAQTFGGEVIPNTEIKLIDQAGTILTAMTDVAGKFSLPDASGLTPPLLLSVNGTQGRAFAAVLEKPTQPTTVNVNRFTRVVVQEALGLNSLGVLADLPGSAKKLTATNVGGALAALRATVGSTVKALGDDPLTFDPASSTRIAQLVALIRDGGYDGKVFSWVSRGEFWADDAPQTLAPTGTALPAPLSTETGVADALAATLAACFAVPPAQRAEFDSTGAVTALKPACEGIPRSTAYLSIGRSFLGRYRALLIDPTIVGASANLEGYANGYDKQPQAVVAVNLFRSGSSDTISDRMSKVAGNWTLVGDGVPYLAFAQPYVERYTYFSPAPAAPTSYAGVNYIASGLTVRLNPAATANTSDLRAVRVTGEGLPAGGVVLAKSTSCGRFDRMPITKKINDKDPTVIAAEIAAVTTTANRGDNFIVQAVRFDGNPVPDALWPGTSVTLSDTPRTSFDGRAYQPYTFALFRGTSQSPSESFVVRAAASIPSYAGRGNADGEWPTFDAATLGYLSLTGTRAAQAASFTLTWAEAVDGFSGPVINVSVGTRGTLAGETALRRVNGGTANPVPGGSKTVTLNAADFAAGDTNPCSASAYPALQDTASNFRDLGLFWTQSGVRYYAGYTWVKF